MPPPSALPHLPEDAQDEFPRRAVQPYPPGGVCGLSRTPPRFPCRVQPETHRLADLVQYRPSTLRFPEQVVPRAVHATIATNSCPKNAHRVQKWVALYILFNYDSLHGIIMLQ